MDDLRDRIYEVVSTLKSARARETAADILEAVIEVASKDKEKGQVLVAFRGDPHRQWAVNTDGDFAPRRIEGNEKPGKAPVLIDASVDAERFESALAKASTVQELAFESGMRIRGSSDFIVAASAAINRRCFRTQGAG